MNVQEWLGNDNQLGIDIWTKKYQYEDETFEEWLDRVSGGDLELRSLIAERKIMLGGRTLANRGTSSSASYFNCYSHGYVEDDYKDIMQTAMNIGLTFKSQGGQGISLSKLRPYGTSIGKEYTSDGIVPFMKIYNEVTAGTSQGGARKGALMISIDARHKEAETFIRIKSQEGLIEKANLSLEIDNKFMNAVDKYYTTGEVVTLHEKRNYSGHIVEYDVIPIDIFKSLVDNCYDWADPAALFVDRFRNYNLMQHDNDYQIETCNPSLRAGTKVLTTGGIFNIEELEGKEFNVYTLDNNIARAKCFLSGKNKQLYKITLSNGESIYCTPEHKWAIKNQNDNMCHKVLTAELSVGDWLPFTRPKRLSNGTQGNYDDGFFFGFWYGDGCVTKRSCDGKNQYGFIFGNEKRDEIKDIIIAHLSKICNKEIHLSERQRDGKIWYEVNYSNSELREYFKKFNVISKDHFPEDMYTLKSEEFRRGFIDGLFSSDGSVDLTKKGEKLCLVTSKKDIANELSDMLWWYGIRNHITITTKNMSLGGRNTKEYARYAVAIGRRACEDFKNIFKLTNNDKSDKLDNLPKLKREYIRDNFIKIESVELTDIYENVWDISVYDDSHTFRLNYCITGNCGEQPLPRHGACCLSSINLSEFIVKPYTEDAYIDTEALVQAVKVGVRTLDKLIDENYYKHPLKEQQEMSFNYRNIGLGCFGYATALMKLSLKYGSDDALKWTDSIFGLIFRAAVIESNELSRQFGPFPKYKDCVWDSDIIKNHFCQDEIDQMREYGLRNCSLISIAPTGSIATCLNESGGCEPEFALSFTRRTIGMTDGQDTYYKVFCKAAREYMQLHNCTEGELPNYFVASSDIPWEARVKTQAIMQNHVDTAISSTVNLPSETTQEDIAKLYILAWKYGLKGITIFRNGCKRMPILSSDDAKKEENVQTDLPRGFIRPASDNVVGKKRKLTTGCGSLHVAAFFDASTGELMETYLSKGSTGGCSNYMVGLSRMISLAARAGCSINDIIDQLNSCGVCPSYAVRKATKHDTSKGSCCPMAVGNALLEMWKEMRTELVVQPANQKENNVEDVKLETPKCPECGEPITHEGGCNICKACGWSKCD